MKEYAISVFESKEQCEEQIQVTPEEAEEVFKLIAEEKQAASPVSENNPYCYLCQQPIRAGQQLEHHHPQYKSRGGTETKPTHQVCHRRYHSQQGDFREWGKIGGQITAITKRWAWNLVNVRTHPAYELERKFYLAHYAS